MPSSYASQIYERLIIKGMGLSLEMDKQQLFEAQMNYEVMTNPSIIFIMVQVVRSWGLKGFKALCIKSLISHETEMWLIKRMREQFPNPQEDPEFYYFGNDI